jgi:hypothetical protein
LPRHSTNQCGCFGRLLLQHDCQRLS